ncbi:hypothetical protein D5086_019126 [Populus alba]|uniref:Uncharacterized protein n=1 Tax=Populus alba TaxID=43335 RepID=A0ACC4BGZ5_POPAL
MYSKCGFFGLAKSLFDSCPKLDPVSWLANLAKEVFEMIPDKDIVSWGTIIDGYVRVERLREALMMYRLMVSTGLGPSEVTMIDLISACGRAMAIVEGQQLHCVVVKTSFDCYDFVQATVIHLYSACGRI